MDAPSPSASPERISRQRLGALCLGLGSLYLAQGVVAGVGTVLVSVMAAQGQSLEAQTGLLAWGALPWVLKLAWALAFDAIAPQGHPRRFWALLSLQLAVAAAVANLSIGAGTNAAALAFFALNLVASWQDVAADAVAVDHAPAERRGLVNAIMAGARALGAGYLGAVVLYPLFASMGMAPALRVYATGHAALSLTLFPLRSLLSGKPEAPRTAAHNGAKELWTALAHSAPARFGLLLSTFALLGDGISGAVSADFLLKRAGWSLEALQGELVPLQVASELAAFALAAWAVDRIGHLRSMALAALGLGLGWLGFGLAEPLWTSHAAVRALTIFESSARALMLVGAYGFLMGATQPKVRATQFVVYMSLLNLPRVVGPLMAPSLFGAVGYTGVWCVAGALQITVALVAWRGRGLNNEL